MVKRYINDNDERYPDFKLTKKKSDYIIELLDDEYKDYLETVEKYEYWQKRLNEATGKE